MPDGHGIGALARTAEGSMCYRVARRLAAHCASAVVLSYEHDPCDGVSEDETANNGYQRHKGWQEVLMLIVLFCWKKLLQMRCACR